MTRENNIEIKTLDAEDIYPKMLMDFKHEQHISQTWANSNGKWELRETSVLREWSDDKRIWITEYLIQQIARGGSVSGAYSDDVLVGFACVDGVILGSTAKYANLTMLFVDDDMKRRGIGRSLFNSVCSHAVELGAEKLFISAIPSVDTVAFYMNMGCTDAEEIIEVFIDTEFDRYLEYRL